jgi:hypothetical protein
MINCIQEYADALLIVFIFAPSFASGECLLSNYHILIKGHLHIHIPSNLMSLSFDCSDKLNDHLFASGSAIRAVHLVLNHHFLIRQIIVSLEINLADVYAPAETSEKVEDLRLGLLNEGSAGVEGLLSHEETLLELAEIDMGRWFL